MFAAMRFVRDHCRVDSTANHVAMVIATFSRRDGTAPASLRQIAAAAMLHTETVQHAIGRLEEAGIIAVDRFKGRRVNVHRFPVVDAVELSTNARPRTAHYETDLRVGMRGFGASNARSRSAQLKQVLLKTQRALAARHLATCACEGTGIVYFEQDGRTVGAPCRQTQEAAGQ